MVVFHLYHGMPLLININILLIRLPHKLALGWSKRLFGRFIVKRLLFSWPSLSARLGFAVCKAHLFIECCEAGGLHHVGELWRLLGQVLAPITARYCSWTWIRSGTGFSFVAVRNTVTKQINTTNKKSKVTYG